MKILVATEKPFAAVAVDGIRKVIEGAGYELELLEKYTTKRNCSMPLHLPTGLSYAPTKLTQRFLMLPNS